MPRITLYVPDDLKARMDAIGGTINWSAIAQRAFADTIKPEDHTRMRDDTIATLRDLERFKAEAQKASDDAETAEKVLRAAQDRLNKANTCIHATLILMKASGWMDDKSNIRGSPKYHFNTCVDAVRADLKADVPLHTVYTYFIRNMRRHAEFAEGVFPEFEAHVLKAATKPDFEDRRGLISWVNQTPMPGGDRDLDAMIGRNSL